MTVADDPKRLPNASEWLTVEEFLDPTLDPKLPKEQRRPLVSETKPTVVESVKRAWKHVSAADFIGFADTVKEVAELKELHDAADDYALGIADEKQLALVMRTYGNARDQSSGLPMVAEVASSVARDAPAFMQEWALSGGAVNVARRAVTGVVKGGVKKAAEAAAERSIAKMLATGAVKGTQVFAAETGISAMTGGGRLQSNLLQRTMREIGMSEDEAGKLSLALEATKPELLAALPAAIVDSLIETISEGSGTALGKLPLMDRLGALEVAFMRRLFKKGYSVDTVTKRLLEHGAWNKYFEEVGEEIYGDTLRTGAGFVVPGAEDLKDSLLYEWEEAAGMMVGIGAVSGGSVAAQLGELYIAYKVDRAAEERAIPDWARDAMPAVKGVVGVKPVNTGEPPALDTEITVHQDTGPAKMRIIGRSVIDRPKDQVEKGEGPEHEEILWAVPVEDEATAETAAAGLWGQKPKAKTTAPRDKPEPEGGAPVGRPAGAANDPLAGNRTSVPPDPLTEEARAYHLASFGSANGRPDVRETLPTDPERIALVDFWRDRGVDVVFADVGADPKVRAVNPRHGVVVVSDAVPLEEGPESLPRVLGHEFVHELAKTDLQAFNRLERLVQRYGGGEYLKANREAARGDMLAAGLPPEAASEQRLREEALAYRAQDLWNTVLAMTEDRKVEMLREALERDETLFGRIKGWVRQLARMFGFRIPEPIMGELEGLGVDLGEVAAVPGVAALNAKPGITVTVRENERAKAQRAKQNTLQAVHLADAMETILAGRVAPSMVGTARPADGGVGGEKGASNPEGAPGAPQEAQAARPAGPEPADGNISGNTGAPESSAPAEPEPQVERAEEGAASDAATESPARDQAAETPSSAPGVEPPGGEPPGMEADNDPAAESVPAPKPKAKPKAKPGGWLGGGTHTAADDDAIPDDPDLVDDVAADVARDAEGDTEAPEEPSNEVEKPEAPPAKVPDAVLRSNVREAIARGFARGEDYSTKAKLNEFIASLGTTAETYFQGLGPKDQEELVEEAVVRAGRRIANDFMFEPADAFKAMVSVYNSQPKLTTRTSTSAERQAYSTPLPLAYIASRLGRIEQGARVLEPTAGTGMLLVDVEDPRLARVNEIDDARAQALRDQGFRPTQEDATEMALADDAFDRVIANPPFGKVRKDNGKARRWKIHGVTFETIDHVIALRSLDAMAPDGRAVLIVGGKMSLTQKDETSEEKRRELYRERDTYAFLSLLHKRFNVVKHAQVSGDLYARQGASWPVDVIVIDGKNPTGDYRDDLPAPAFEKPPMPLTTWDQVGALLNEADSLDAPELPAGSGGGASAATEGPSGDVGTVERPGGVPGGEDAPKGDGGAPKRAPRRPRNRGLPGDVPGQAGPVAGDPDAGGASAPGPGPGAGEPVAPPSDAGERGGEGAADGRPGPVDVPRDLRRDDERTDLAPADEALDEGAQARHIPVSGMKTLDTLVPANLVAPTRDAMDDLRREVGDVDAFVAERLGTTKEEMRRREWFGAEQVEALAMAMIQIESGKGFINAAQTGIGKGRWVAGLIQYAHRKGLTPIFITARPVLYADMYRDLYDTGMLDYLRGRYGKDVHLQAYVTNENNDLKEVDEETGDSLRIILPPEPGTEGPGAELRAPTDKARKAVQKVIAETGKLPDGYHVVMTTYSQLAPVNQKWRPRHADLRRLAPGSFLILDESHKAAGEPKRAGRDQEDEDAELMLSVAQIARELVASAKSVAYSSATWAKNMKAFGLYSRTDLGRVAEVVSKLGEGTGDVPFMGILARGLSRAKQLLRFEKSFDGIEMTRKTVALDEAAVGAMTARIDDIYQFDLSIADEREKAVEALVRSGRGARDAGIGDGTMYATEFFTVMHNLVGQMMVALKAEAAAQEAIAAVKRGEKAVIAISKTFGTSLKEFAAANGVEPGETFEMSFRRLFEQYLERVMRITLKDPTGTKTYVNIEDQLSATSRGRANQIRTMLREMSFAAAPASPIDYMRWRIAQEGITVEEITGRNVIAEYVGPDRYRLATRMAGSASKTKTVTDFNAGKIDVVIINKSGAEGISMHASDRFKDKKPRRMIVAEFEQDVNDVMQLFGRINRTGQGPRLPRYTLLTSNVPAELRPLVAIMRRLASLNANTSAGRKGSFEIDAPDFMNRYGDQAVEEFLKERADLALRLFRGEVPAKKDLARKFAGRIAIIPPADQRALLDEVDERYNAILDAVNDAGTNTLVVPRRRVLEGPMASAEMDSPLVGSAFDDPVFAKKYRIEVPRRPMSLELVKKRTADFIKKWDSGLATEFSNRRGAVERRLATLEDAAQRAAAVLRTAPAPEVRDPVQKEYKAAMVGIAQARAFLDSLATVVETVGTMRGLGSFLVKPKSVAPGFEGETFLVGFKLSPISEGGNHAAPSSLKVHSMPVMSGRLEWVPMTQAAPALVGRAAFTVAPSPMRLSDEQLEVGIAKRNAPPSEHTGYFITGNLIGGLGLYGKQAKNIVYLDMPDGSKVEALWMPDDFNPAARPATTVGVSPTDLGAFMASVVDAVPGRHLRSADAVEVSVGGGKLELRVASRGNRKVYTSRRLREIIGGDLVRRGSGAYMAPLTVENITPAIEHLVRDLNQDFSFADTETRDAFEAWKKSDNHETYAVRRRPRKLLSQLDLPPETVSQWLRRRFVRMMQRLHDYQRGLIAIGGIITDSTDVVLAERLLHGRVRERLRELHARYEKPIVEAMAAAGISQREIDRYLYARHAPSRNRVIEERQAAAGNEDPQADGSGMDTALAYEIVAEYEADERRGEEFQQIGKLVDAMMEDSLTSAAQYGLISDEQFDTYITQWEHYIPLRTTMESRQRSLFETGRELGAKGPEFRRAMGRQSEADSPLAYALHQAQRTILRGERNRVGQAFRNLLLDRENAALIDAREEEMADEAGDPEGEPDALIERELDLDLHTLTVKVGGKGKRIIIKDKLVVRAMKRLGADALPEWLAPVQKAMRLFGSMVTQLDPEFIVRNAMRDYWQALIHLDGEHPGLLADAALPQNWHSAWRALVWYYKNPEATPQNEWQTFARDLARAGGLPGYFGLQKMEDRIEEINKEVARLTAEGKSKAAMRAMFSFFEVESQSIEGAMRLVAYRALVRRGLSVKQAASFAKDMTVNFDQKGEWGAGINAAYLFWNASVQGIYRTLAGFVRSSRMRRWAAGIVVFGVVNGFLQRIVGGDDDDGIPFYDKRSPIEKDSKIIFMIPGTGRAVTIPMPYVYNALYRLGDHLAALWMGAETPTQAVGSVWNLAAATVNPWGQERHIALLAVPTLADPFANIILNEKFHGGPVFPDLSRYEQKSTPDSELVWDRNANDLVHKFARAASELTGGDETEGGLVDMSPESMRHLFEFYLGGVGKFVSRGLTEGSKVASGDPVDWGNVPMFRTVIGSSEQSWRTEEANFYRWTDRVLDVDVKLKRAEERNRPDRMGEIEEDYAAEMSIEPEAKAARQRIRALRADAMAERDPAARREILDMIRGEVRSFNQLAYGAGMR